MGSTGCRTGGDVTDALKKLSFLDRGVAQVALVVENLDLTVEQYWRNFGIGP